MQFESADPSVVKSIRQRYLLNEWLRAAGKQRSMPLLRDFHLDRIDDEMVDMMGYDVVGDGDDEGDEIAVHVAGVGGLGMQMGRSASPGQGRAAIGGLNRW